MVFAPIISVLRRMEKKNSKFEVSVDYIGRPCLKKQNISKNIGVVFIKSIFISTLFYVICTLAELKKYKTSLFQGLKLA
jgi:hypothetical protein